MESPIQTEAALFDAARRLSEPAARQRYLDDACPDSAVRARVEALLRVHDSEQSFLRPEAAAPTIDLPAASEQPGTMIGPYKLLERVGAGGMGDVWMAEQTQPVRRKVAAKVIRAGMDTAQVVARFEAERQALALMDHPNIARVFDGGTTDRGRPFFVMELVKGIPITKYADDHRMPVRERLGLLADVCRAVQHAHQKGVIHRDLKPSNVLVAPYDGRPVVKVIDFGIAKATGPVLTERTLFTAFGAVVGTPEYMSPEQAEVNNQDVDTRSDIYSLGVLLYELMTGSTPLTRKRVKDVAILEVLRVIREEEPPRPSTRLLSTPELPSIAACRGLEPKKLNSLVRGELDWIVMKALEKDRNRRYESANALAADIQRYLNDEAVQACPPSPTYRLRKFAGRNKSALAILTVLFAALVTTGTVATVGHFRISAALTREAAANKQLEGALYYQTIDLAERARNAGQVRLAEQLLLECKPAHRGWEWHYLNRLRYGQMPAVEHPSHLFALAASRDGRLVAVGGSDGTVTVRDGQRLGVIRVRRAHSSWARSLAFSPDSQRLVSGGWDRRIWLWNMTDDAPVWQAKADDIVQCVAYHPDGHLIASSGASGHVQLWDARTGDERTWATGSAITNHDDNLFALTFSPDGRQLAGGGSDGRVKIWRTEDGSLLHHLPAQSEQVLGLAYSPDGRLLAAASGGFYTKEQRGEVGIWETTSGRRLHRLGGPNGSAFCVAFSPDGTRVAAGGSADPSVRVWDVGTGAQAIRLSGHREAVWSVAFSPDGNRLYSSSGDRTLRVWDARPLTSGPETERGVLADFASEVHGIAFHPDGKLLATACPEGDVQIWNARTSQLVQTIPVKGTSCVAFSRDGRWLAAGSFGVIHVWQAPAWERRDPILTGDMVNAVSFHPTNGQLAAAVGKTVGIWDVATGVPRAPPAGHTNFLLSAVYSPDGRTIASAGFEGEIKVWDADPRPTSLLQGAIPSPAPPWDWLARAWVTSPGHLARNLTGHVGRVSCIAFSPDGKHLVSAGVDGVFHRWDTATWTRTTPALSHHGHVRALAFSPDGSQLASTGSDATVRVWDAHDFRPLFALRGHTDSIGGIAFSPDADLIASVSLDRTVRIWNAKPPPDSAAVTAVDPGK